MIVKVCGVRTPDIAEAAIDAGADWIGLMFVRASPRWAGDAVALAVMRAVAGRADLIGVFIEPSAAVCDEASARYRLAAVQVHGRLDANLVAQASVPVIPVVNVASRESAYALEWPPDVLMMLDGNPDTGALPGGTGHRVPLDWAADVARHRRVLLAGGLGPADVATAIATVHPAGVDASSRLERSPGEKDEALVRDFVAAARSAAAQLEGVAR
ncbi:MAG TPA: phosphoribosylanthranilate isomerase [Candidatus Dormibacteraeota bacterium]